MPADVPRPTPLPILVAGEALFDLVLRDGRDQLGAHPGGGPFNAARTIARLEQPAAFVGRLSTDRLGRRLEALLAGDGVSLGSVVRTDEPTTLALAEVDEDGVARYRFYERGTSAPGLTEAAALAALPPAVGVLHLGTLGLVLEPMAAALEAVAARLAGDALVFLDPNCRPAVIADPAGYRRRLDRVLAHSDVVKVSEEDIAWLEPGRPPVEAVRGLLAHGPALGLLTRGQRGAVVVTPEGETPVPAPRVRVADTIGAGDAFGGGFVAWWRERGLGRADLAREDLVAGAARFACLVAARTCERPGASPPRRAELS
jgi:fructokinase